MDLNIDQDQLHMDIVSRAADAVIDDEKLFERVRTNIDERVDKIFADKVQAQIDSIVMDAVKDAFEKEYQPIDQFGGPQGEPTKISKRLAKICEDYWTERVNGEGKPTTEKYRSTSRAEWVMLKITGDDFAKEFKQQMTNVTGSLKDGLRKEMREWIDRSLGDLFKVRSAMDKEEGRRS